MSNGENEWSVVGGMWRPRHYCDPERKLQQEVRRVESILGQNPVDTTTEGSRYENRIVSMIIVAFE